MAYAGDLVKSLKTSDFHLARRRAALIVLRLEIMITSDPLPSRAELESGVRRWIDACVWRQEIHRAETRGIEHFDLAEIDHMGEAEARELDGLLRFGREHFAEDEKSRLRLVLAGDAPGDITTTVALTASDTAKAFQRAGEHTLKFRSAGRADYYGVGIESGREIGEA